MEKFSKFNDPITGQNPFASLPQKRISLSSLFLLLYRLPLLILYFFGVNTIPFLIKIKCDKKYSKKIITNSITVFDSFVIRYLFPQYVQFYNVKAFNGCKEHSILFIEECTSNGKMLVKFKDHVRCDGAIFMKYSNTCVYSTGSKLFFYLRFLAGDNSVDVNMYDVKNSNDYVRKCRIPQSVFGINDKNEYLKQVKQYQKWHIPFI